MKEQILYFFKDDQLAVTMTLEPSGLDHFVFSEDTSSELCEEIMSLRKTISETDLAKRKTAFQEVYSKSGFVVGEYAG